MEKPNIYQQINFKIYELCPRTQSTLHYFINQYIYQKLLLKISYTATKINYSF